MNKQTVQSTVHILLSPLKILNQVKLYLFIVLVFTLVKIIIPLITESAKVITYSHHISYITIACAVTAALLKITQYLGDEVFISRPVFSSHMSTGIMEFMIKLTKGFIVLLAGLMILDSFGVSITPILASLGIGSLAIALALQDTLGNLFSGVYLIFDQPFQEGDFIKVEGGPVEGIVTKIGWRSTRILMLQNNTITIPNSKLSSSVLVNFFHPTPETNLTIPLSVVYESDLKKVEVVTLAVAKKVLTSNAVGVGSFDPILRFYAFNSSNIDFNLILKVNNYLDRHVLIHDFIRALKEAYDENGIETPAPTSTPASLIKKTNTLV